MIPPMLLPSQFFSSKWVALLERRELVRSVSELPTKHQFAPIHCYKGVCWYQSDGRILSHCSSLKT
jgi:hypothetical protein